MIYELHITTEPTVDIERWVALCGGLKIKPLHIALATGEHPSQVMMAATHEGDDASAARWAITLSDAIVASGFPIVRSKLEIPLDKGVLRPPGAYSEAHVKLLLHPETAKRLPVVAKDTGMHVSRNLLQPDVAGLGKWYLTLRYYGTSANAAASVFADAYGAVSRHLPGVRMEMEKVLSDSNPGLDAGWAGR